MQVTAIHPANVTERRLTLKRVSPAFAEAVQEYRENRKGKEQQEDDRLAEVARRFAAGELSVEDYQRLTRELFGERASDTLPGTLPPERD